MHDRAGDVAEELHGAVGDDPEGEAPGSLLDQEEEVRVEGEEEDDGGEDVGGEVEEGAADVC